jgi:hypothetical protein
MGSVSADARVVHNCDALHDPERDHWIILYTAVPGTPDHDALRLLNVIGTQHLTARQ